MLEWNETYSTGVAEIDEQHKELFNMINKFEESVNDGTAPQTMRETLQFLGRYTKMHFSHEEGCMLEHHCAASEKNKAAHKAFLDLYSKFVNKFHSEGYSDQLAMDLHRVFEMWLDKHICNIDVQLKPCVQKVKVD